MMEIHWIEIYVNFHVTLELIELLSATINFVYVEQAFNTVNSTLPNCHDCKKLFHFLGSALYLMRLIFIHPSKGGVLKKKKEKKKKRSIWTNCACVDWQHSYSIMEHYLPVLNTVMHIFRSSLSLENCFNF